jgi:hypothetical protein
LIETPRSRVFYSSKWHKDEKKIVQEKKVFVIYLDILYLGLGEARGGNAFVERSTTVPEIEDSNPTTDEHVIKKMLESIFFVCYIKAMRRVSLRRSTVLIFPFP